MNIPDYILEKESPTVRRMYSYWKERMLTTIDFWPLEDIGLDIDPDVHNVGHCMRVLLLSLKIGELRHLSERSMTALCEASIIHDSRRRDNYTDRGHGFRAATYYRRLCKSSDLEFLPETFFTVMCHDEDDSVGEEKIRNFAPAYVEHIWDDGLALTREWLEVFHDFKDADALDRLRLGPWALNEKYLRTEEAKSLVGYAQKLVEATIDPETLKKTMDATRKFIAEFQRSPKKETENKK